jgi:hypothetical protein
MLHAKGFYMSRTKWSLVLMLIGLLSACGLSQQTAQVPPTGTAAPTTPATVVPAPAATEAPPTLVPATALPPAATEAPALVPTTAPAATEVPPIVTATAPPVVAQGREVLTIPAGNGANQVGVTANDGPTTFRIAADGSIRIMDTVNKRLLFFSVSTSSVPAKLTQTLDLSFLQRPTDFVVTGKGDLYVLDAEAWNIAHLSIDGKELNNIPLNPATKGKFTTISLTADGRIMGLADTTSYILATPGGPIPLEDQPHAQIDGVVTVRSNAIFSIAADSDNQRYKSLLINYGGAAPGGVALGDIDGQLTFLDINQGMEPYVLVKRGTNVEVQRSGVAGQLLGTLNLDLSGCRPVARGLYVDRPGDVYTMCVSDQGLTIKQYSMVDGQGQPLPRYEQLVDSAPWAPGSLQSAPG